MLHSDPLAQWYEKMTSSSKPEVHNLSQCCQRRNEPWSQATCTKNSVKFGHVVFEFCERMDRQTDIFITILCIPPRGEAIMRNNVHTASTREITHMECKLQNISSICRTTQQKQADQQLSHVHNIILHMLHEYSIMLLHAQLHITYNTAVAFLLYDYNHFMVTIQFNLC